VQLPLIEIVVALSVLLAGFFDCKRTQAVRSDVERISRPLGSHMAMLLVKRSMGRKRRHSARILLALSSRYPYNRFSDHHTTHKDAGSQLGPRLVGAAILGIGFTVLVGQLIPGV